MLNVLLDRGVQEIVFSSLSATYGVPEQLPIDETHPQNQVSPYGESKLAIEKVLRWYDDAYDLKWISLRTKQGPALCQFRSR
jgi:UDP-glucose 4-epimerase